MSDAKVEFHTDDEQAAATAPHEFVFRCPRSGRRCGPLVIAGRTDLKRDGQGKGGGCPQWEWNGDAVAPTFNPSVDCKGCWHGFIRAGRCVDTAGRTEPEPLRIQ